MSSPSLLKKKLKSENTSYSQIITTCRMRYAVNELMMDGKNISQVSQSCGYNSTSYFISVFKDFYGMTPLHYVSQHQRTHCRLIFNLNEELSNNGISDNPVDNNSTIECRCMI